MGASGGNTARRIVRNAGQCAICKDIIESAHRHDWRACSCGAIYVDGGKSYLRRGGDPANFIELAEFEDDPPLPGMPLTSEALAAAKAAMQAKRDNGRRMA